MLFFSARFDLAEEKAARGTNGRKYPWGDEAPTNGLANFNGNVGYTTPVGSYPKDASPYGALDMAGNVWESVEDFYTMLRFVVNHAVISIRSQ